MKEGKVRGEGESIQLINGTLILQTPEGCGCPANECVVPCK